MCLYLQIITLYDFLTDKYEFVFKYLITIVLNLIELYFCCSVPIVIGVLAHAGLV